MNKNVIVVKVADIKRSKHNKTDGIIKNWGKWIILRSVSHLFEKPLHWKVKIEIIGEGKNSRFGKILEIIKELTEEEKTEKAIIKLLAPIVEEDSGPFALVKLWSDDDEMGIFSNDTENSILNTALIHEASWWTPDKIYRASSLVDNRLRLNSELAKKIWREQIAVWKERKQLFDKVVSIWEEEEQRLNSNREIRGRNYSDWLGRFVSKPKKLWTKIPLFVPYGKDYPLFEEDHGEVFSWTKEGVDDYKKELADFVSREIQDIRSEANNFFSQQLDRLKNGSWVLGTHTVVSCWTAYHDGFGSHSEYDVASSGTKEHHKKGLMLLCRIGTKVNITDKGAFISLTDEEYDAIIDYIGGEVLLQTELQCDWLIAKAEREDDRYKEQIALDFFEEQSHENRFQEILRRLNEGWLVRVRDRKTGAVEKFSESMEPYDKRQDLAIIYEPKSEKYFYTAYGSYGRSCRMSSTRLVARKFYTYISWEEYQRLPEIKGTKELRTEADRLVKKVWKNRISDYAGKYPKLFKEVTGMHFYISSPFKNAEDLDYLRGYIVQMRQLLNELLELQEAEEFLNSSEEDLVRIEKNSESRAVFKQDESEELAERNQEPKKPTKNLLGKHDGNKKGLTYSPFAALIQSKK